jgi:hypothetical protein
MRNITFIASKDHLVYVVLADNVCDELTATDINMVNSSNGGGTFIHSGIGFGVEGSANAFHYKNLSWEFHGEYVAPYLVTQYNANTSTSFLFGAAATSNNSLYVGVIPREASVNSSIINITQEVANTFELLLLGQGSNSAFQLMKICQAATKRNLITFDKLTPIEETIPDSDIEFI